MQQMGSEVVTSDLIGDGDSVAMQLFTHSAEFAKTMSKIAGYISYLITLITQITSVSTSQLPW